jgi:phosphotriesterase-related protein
VLLAFVWFAFISPRAEIFPPTIVTTMVETIDLAYRASAKVARAVRVETVTGTIEARDLGATLMHEHIASLAPPGFYSGGNESDVGGLAAQSLQPLADLGIASLVDLTGMTRATNLEAEFARLHQMAMGLPVQVIAGFAYYKEPFLERLGDEDLDQLTERYIEAATIPIAGVRVGVFGEVGTSLDVILPREELHLRAVARAHVATGLAISTHCTLGTMALEQAQILRSEGADLGRVVLGHLDLRPEVDYLERVLATGVNLGFDTLGKEWFDYRVPGSEGQGGGSFVKWTYHRRDEDRLAALALLCERGYDSRIVISSDMSGAEAYLNPTTHGRFGYAYLHRVVLPRLRSLGVMESSLQRMLVENPARILGRP